VTGHKVRQQAGGSLPHGGVGLNVTFRSVALGQFPGWLAPLG